MGILSPFRLSVRADGLSPAEYNNGRTTTAVQQRPYNNGRTTTVINRPGQIFNVFSQQRLLGIKWKVN